MNSLNYSSYFTYKDKVSRSISWGHWFALLNIFLSLLIGCAYLYNTPSPSTALGTAYLIISWLGHFSFLVFVIYILIFFPMAFLCRSTKVYRIISIILTTALMTLLLVDVKLYQSIKMHLNISVIGLFFEQEGFSTGLNYNFLFIATPMLALIECYFSTIAWKNHYLHRFQKMTVLVTIAFTLAFLSTHIMHIWANAYKYVPITQQKSIFPAYYPMTANTFLKEHGLLTSYDTNSSNNQVERNNIQISSQKLHYPLNTIRVTPNEEPLNVILILINGISYEHMTNEYMPNLFKYASSHDSYIKNYLGNIEGMATIFEMIYGIPAHYMNTVQSEKYPPIIISEMLQQDYKISSFITGKTPNNAKQLANISSIRLKNVNSYANDTTTVFKAVEWITGTEWPTRPQFTTISLNSPKTLALDKNATILFTPQIDAPVVESNSITEENVTKLKNRYLNSVYNTDHQLGLLLEALNENKILKKSVLIITSSSGFDLSNYMINSKNEYRRNDHHVPLVIAWPDAVIPARISAISSAQDIAPTIAREVLHIQNNEDDYTTGTNLRELQNRAWVISGSKDQLNIISADQTTIFDKHGTATTYNDNQKETIPPNMSTLIKAMKLMNRFSN